MHHASSVCAVIFSLVLAACAPRAQTGLRAVAAPPAPAPPPTSYAPPSADEQPLSPCGVALALSRRNILAGVDAALDAAIPAAQNELANSPDGDQSWLERLTELKAEPPYDDVYHSLVESLPGTCWSTPHGAWALVIDPPSNVEPGVSNQGQFIAEVSLAHVDRSGQIALQRVNAFMAQSPGRTFGFGPVGLFDYDGDGEPEIFVSTSWAHEGSGDMWSKMYTLRDGKLAPFGPYAPGFPLQAAGSDSGLHDVDGDGRPDLEIQTELGSTTACISGFESRGFAPPLVAHARPDGSFSVTDEAAVRFTDGWCNVRPRRFRTGLDVACARLQGEPVADVEKRLARDASAWDCALEEKGKPQRDPKANKDFFFMRQAARLSFPFTKAPVPAPKGEKWVPRSSTPNPELSKSLGKTCEALEAWASKTATRIVAEALEEASRRAREEKDPASEQARAARSFLASGAQGDGAIWRRVAQWAEKTRERQLPDQTTRRGVERSVLVQCRKDKSGVWAFIRPEPRLVARDPANWLNDWIVEGTQMLVRISPSGDVASLPSVETEPFPATFVDVDADGILEVLLDRSDRLHAVRDGGIVEISDGSAEPDGIVEVTGSSGRRVRVRRDGRAIPSRR
jgi:hypothetical protein